MGCGGGGGGGNSVSKVVGEGGKRCNEDGDEGNTGVIFSYHHKMRN